MDPKNDFKYFCTNVRNLRLKHNLSIPEMAKLLELSEDNLTFLESGVLTDEMDVTILSHIHDHFGIMPSALFGEEYP